MDGGSDEGSGHGACRVHGFRDRRPDLRGVPGASGAGDLHRHPRAGAPDSRRERHARRCGGARAGAEHPRRALSGGQLRLGLQLGGRDRAEGGAADPARPGLAYFREQPGGHPRVRRLVRHGRDQHDAGGEPRVARPGRGPQLPRVRQSSGRQRMVGPAAAERARGALERQALVPRQRDGRALADRPQDRRGIRAAGERDGQGDARPRPEPGAGGLRVVELRHADLSAVGGDGARGDLRGRGLHLAAYVFREPREEHG